MILTQTDQRVWLYQLSSHLDQINETKWHGAKSGAVLHGCLIQADYINKITDVMIIYNLCHHR